MAKNGAHRGGGSVSDGQGGSVDDGRQQAELLFLAVTGGFRSPSVLNKVFEEVGREMGLTMRFTQRGMRRTFNDIARAAKIEGVVTRSISGHLTERMQLHYSTVSADEQRAGIGRVVDRLVRGSLRSHHLRR